MKKQTTRATRVANRAAQIIEEQRAAQNLDERWSDEVDQIHAEREAHDTRADRARSNYKTNNHRTGKRTKKRAEPRRRRSGALSKFSGLFKDDERLAERGVIISPLLIDFLAWATRILSNAGAALTVIGFLVSIVILDIAGGAFTVSESMVGVETWKRVLFSLPLSFFTSGIQTVGWYFLFTSAWFDFSDLKRVVLFAGIAFSLAGIAVIDSTYFDLPVVNMFLFGESPLNAVYTGKPPFYYATAFMYWLATTGNDPISAFLALVLRQLSRGAKGDL